MGCFSCFKSSPSLDSSDDEFNRALTFSRHEAVIEEDEHIALATKESSREEEEEKRRTRAIEEEKRCTRAIEEEERRRARALEEERRRARELEEERMRARALEEERRRTRMMEEDAQIANGFLYDDRERQINHNSALEEEQITKAIAESLIEKAKRKQFEEQVKKDEQFTLNMVESPPRTKDYKSIPRRAQLDEDEQIYKGVKESLKAKGKRKQFEDEQVKNDEQIAAIYQESLNNMVESPPRLAEIKNISTRASWDEDEQLENVLRESLKGKGIIEKSKDEVEDDGNLQMVNLPRIMCGGCNSEIEHGKSVDVLGVLWHPQCLWCDACDKSIAIHQIRNHVSNSRGRYHKACYERYCYICKEKKLKAFHQHHFWKERYCPSHDTDGTPKCCSCERLEPRGTNYVMLGDSRCLCLECMDSAVMDTYEVQPLHFEIREYFEGLNMKIEKQFPFLLVEKQALNKAEKEEKIPDNQYETVTRGICLSEEQTVTSVTKKATMDLNKQLIPMTTESYRVVSDCEVTAVLIIYGLPRLLTGYILAHEMMHAYLRLNGHRNLNNVLEEGLCQVLGHMWLDSQTYAAIDTAASSSRTPPAAVNESKKGACSDFEKKLVEFCKNQIEEDDSPVYGRGFKEVSKMVSSSSLPDTLKKITRRG